MYILWYSIPCQAIHFTASLKLDTVPYIEENKKDRGKIKKKRGNKIRL